MDDVPDLKRIVESTYTKGIFETDDVTPLKTLEPGFHLLGLSNGPTLAFKDIAMQLLGNLFESILKKEHATLNILGATSGETGSADEQARRGKAGIQVFMRYTTQLICPYTTRRWIHRPSYDLTTLMIMD